jgi:hypothetical protein
MVMISDQIHVACNVVIPEGKIYFPEIKADCLEIHQFKIGQCNVSFLYQCVKKVSKSKILQENYLHKMTMLVSGYW